MLNGSFPVTLKALKESTVSVNLVNQQDIGSEFSVPVEWDHKNEYVLEIPVQSYLTTIGITVKAKADTYAGKPAELSSSHSITFKDSRTDTSYA